MKLPTAAYFAMTLLLTPTHGQDAPSPPTTFEGLGGVTIMIEPPSEKLAEAGITETVLRAAVERRLKDAGVPVHPPGDPELAPGFPALYLQVITIFDDYSKQCTWSIRVELNQFVRMERNPDTVAVAASTWSVGGIGFQTRKWRDALLADVERYVDAFIETMAASNPEGLEP
jgi:hypothetical protein